MEQQRLAVHAALQQANPAGGGGAAAHNTLLMEVFRKTAELKVELVKEHLVRAFR
jgi:hypothetical protein